MDDDAWAIVPPPAMETREEFLQSLRESVAESKAGDYGMTVQEAFGQLGAPLFAGKGT
jgi:hypothetical protein